MRIVPLLLLGTLLACSADLSAQDTQTPRIHQRVPPVIASTTGAIDLLGTDLRVPNRHPLRSSKLGFTNESLLRVVIPFLGIVEVEKTDRGLYLRRPKCCYSTW